MKKTFTFLVILLLTMGLVNANERNNAHLKSEDSVTKNNNIGKELTNQSEIHQELNTYLKIEEEGAMDYIYNPQNNNIVMYFKDGVRSLTLKAVKRTRQLTNVYYNVNDEFTLHVVVYNDTKNIVDVRTRKYFPEYDRTFSVITDEKK
ncbi:hypothetical protein KMW28_26025 [Flammeovirga yaeyamensis]|uniref:Uncharacterized protein n=1 Tax=Flammeovirga yaeyamensis TaxID=367791 RepID=A0AAX1NDJ8_9BACT|nr:MULTISPECIES: hypothetical protein [Flammeovirga]ANQ52092.2 hypothetical protein MY04_4757 [Flammeovirga sp. MY04]MBB3699241.1 hypothetical protein [Flammeovirga yaeyamensis]NMF35496.1 hypothetical protein [Flammeovirga yaeyamensis]QWG04355.1 hypothetical protein KMW28_26025 [Flammeovirga yaeyamensis]